MTALVLAVVAGGSLLLSAPETTELMEGAIEWHEESILRAVVRLLCLNYEFPTHYPDTIKGYLLGLGAGLAALAYAIRVWTARPEEPLPGLGHELRRAARRRDSAGSGDHSGRRPGGVLPVTDPSRVL